MKTHKFPIAVGLILPLVSIASLSADSLDNWHLRHPPQSTHSLHAVTYGNGLFVAVGHDRSSSLDWIVTSLDGRTWTSHSSSTSNQLNAVCFGDGTYVAVGQRPDSGNGETAVIVTSTNGTTWDVQGLYPSTQLTALTHGNDLFVVVGYERALNWTGVVLTSSDGIHWTSQSLTNSDFMYSAYLIGVTYGQGFFVATSGNGYTLTSVDGAGWVNRGQSVNSWAITYGNGLFVKTSGESSWPATSFYTSADAQTWTYGGFASGFFHNHGLTYGNGVFVVAADGFPGRIVYSRDAIGMAWYRATVGDLWISDVAYGKGTFVAVGNTGTGDAVIMQSDGLPTAHLSTGQLSGMGFALSIAGEAGIRYRLQATTNLSTTNWVELLAFTNTGSAINFTDMAATNSNRRFYRVVSP